MPTRRGTDRHFSPRWYIHTDAEGVKALFQWIPFAESAHQDVMCLDDVRRNLIEVSEKTLKELARDQATHKIKFDVFVNYDFGIRPYKGKIVVDEIPNRVPNDVVPAK